MIVQKLSSAVIVVLLLCSCREELVQNIDESRAHRVITDLYTLGIEAKKVKHAEGRWGVEVQKRDLARAIAILTNRKLMPEGDVEQIAQPGIMDSKEERQFAFQRKLSFSLEKTLETFPHILRARVHINFPPESDSLSAISQSVVSNTLRLQKGSASVLVLADHDAEVTADQIVAIVAGASGLTHDAVLVVFEKVPAMPVVTREQNSILVESYSRTPETSATNTSLQKPSTLTLMWGSAAYLMGIVGLLVFLGVILLKKHKTLVLGQKILYEGK